MKKTLKQILLITIGQIIISAGVSLMLTANLGLDPLGVFHTGVGNTFGITFAKALFFENVIVIIVLFFLDRKYIDIATLLSMFLVSITTSFYLNLYQMILGTDLSMLVRYICIVVAAAIVAFGYNFYIIPNRGIAPMDVVAEIISEKGKLDFKKVKIATDLAFLVGGYLLGGSVGVATIILAFLVGPFISFFRNILDKPLNDFIES